MHASTLQRLQYVLIFARLSLALGVNPSLFRHISHLRVPIPFGVVGGTGEMVEAVGVVCMPSFVSTRRVLGVRGISTDNLSLNNSLAFATIWFWIPGDWTLRTTCGRTRSSASAHIKTARRSCIFISPCFYYKTGYFLEKLEHQPTNRKWSPWILSMGGKLVTTKLVYS